MLANPFGRTVNYLRIFVTDRCDLRCIYCLPEDFKGSTVPKDWLTVKEAVRVAATSARLGTKRFRLTSGEPLLRKGLTELVVEISRQPGVEDISLATNGIRLGQQARALRTAGVRRLNISLGSLCRDCVASITDSDCLPQALEGVTATKEADSERIKINMAPLKGINDTDLDDVVAFCIQHGSILNFIEAIPMGATGQMHVKVNLQPVLEDLRRKFGLTPFEGRIGGGPARYWYNGSSGFTLGLTTLMSQHFCATCNRMRPSAAGNIHLCLGQEDKVPLRDLLHGGCTDAELDQKIRDAIVLKPEKHEFVENPEKIIRVMTLTGG